MTTSGIKKTVYAKAKTAYTCLYAYSNGFLEAWIKKLLNYITCYGKRIAPFSWCKGKNKMAGITQNGQKSLIFIVVSSRESN